MRFNNLILIRYASTHEMVKHTPTIRWLLPTSCLSVFDHFMGLVLKGLALRLYIVKWTEKTDIVMIVYSWTYQGVIH